MKDVNGAIKDHIINLLKPLNCRVSLSLLDSR